MKILARLPMPAGKITIRHRQMRGVWQCFAGRNYVAGASGDSPQQAAEEFVRQYKVPIGTPLHVLGLRDPLVILSFSHEA